MRRHLLAAALVLAVAGLAHARGIVIPTEKSIPPLAMLNHKVEVTMVDQVATTKLTQTFRNHTSRELEATYMFPVPKGANVREFAMWVDGKKVKGELIEAAKARHIYTDMVRRTEDPGLLEYLGNDLLQMKIFPIPPKGDQKIEVSFQSIARREHEIVEYTYPLKTDGKATSTLEDFTMKITLKSQQPIANIYSPTHAIGIQRTNDKEAVVNFEKSQALLDKDFTILYTTSSKDVGLTTLLHRPLTAEDGYFMLLISPRAELSKEQQVPRDMVFVLDTSGSMREDIAGEFKGESKMDQAKRALKYCLSGLTEKDRFALINFGTTVNHYRDALVQADKERIGHAKEWVDKLEPNGGTAINDALLAALELNSKDTGRTFNVVFFTDGKPTIGETKPDVILGNLVKKNTENVRVFTFGVGNDQNATLLDQVAERTKAVSTFVRPGEEMEVKVSNFFEKISKPVLANLKLKAGPDVSLLEVYPPHLPDLFHGGQVVVMGRYHGTGATAITLTGSIGKETREFVYETDFVGKSEDKPFVEELWARRKVGYLLEQIRLNGEKKELVDEVVALAKKYGIATPYTSYLIVPDANLPVAGGKDKPKPEGDGVPRTSAPVPAFMPLPGESRGGGTATGSYTDINGAKYKNVEEFAKLVQKGPGDMAKNRGWWEDRTIADLDKKDGKSAGEKELAERYAQKKAYDDAQKALEGGRLRDVQLNKLGVDLSCEVNLLKNQYRLQQTALRRANNRDCMEIGGVWIDQGFNAQTKVLAVTAQSDAYFRILEKRPEMKDVYQLGNYLVWVAPNGTALVIDAKDGKEKLTDAEIDALFAAMK